jgi:hypothetical protein
MQLQITEGTYHCEGDGIVSCKVYDPNGFWIGNRTYSNGASYDSEPAGTLLSEEFFQPEGVLMLTDCGFREVPEWEVFEKETDFEKEVREFEDFVNSIMPDEEFANWLTLFHNKDTNQLAMQLVEAYNQPIIFNNTKQNAKRR